MSYFTWNFDVLYLWGNKLPFAWLDTLLLSLDTLLTIYPFNCRISGNPVQYLEFIESFQNNIHSKVTFNDDIRMARLFSVLEGDAKDLCNQ